MLLAIFLGEETGKIKPRFLLLIGFLKLFIFKVKFSFKNT